MEARHGYGLVLALMQSYPRAVAELETAVRLAPDRAPARVDLADVLATLGRLDEARREYLAAIRLDPANREARAAWRRCVVKAGNQANFWLTLPLQNNRLSGASLRHVPGQRISPFAIGGRMVTRFTVSFRLVFVVAALVIPISAMSQSFYGSLVAVVQDPQGGVMPGATIVLANTATNERREGVSGEDGTYRFVNLVPGTYRLEVELTGFQRYVRDQIQVNVQSTPRIAVTLQLGSLQETISVSGEAPQLQTESASVGTVVGTRAVQELPLNGRNVLNLITVAPTVVPQGGSEGSLTGKNVFAAGNYQIGGGVANQSASLYDGVPLQDTAYGNIVVLTPSPEAVEEFRVQTNNSSAEFGRFTGGVVNMASRSGTNAFRGSAFEYLRNKALNSNTFFGERAGLDKPPFMQNNFGGVLGGPVLKNKLFFFSSYEGYRNREGVLFRRTVPTAAMKRGDFSDYRNLATGAVVPIYDPWTQCGINNPGTGRYNGDCGTVPNRLQFPGNIIPANRISPIARNISGLPGLRRADRAGPVEDGELGNKMPRSAATTIRSASAATTT